jgi:hypothetical protein
MIVMRAGEGRKIVEEVALENEVLGALEERKGRREAATKAGGLNKRNEPPLRDADGKC